ncbi:unnamed protein product [Gongylonema pulchrum]|uniref:Uncharacterized protein n=1 Tax=Gongylonema pulchrum TaxID=637853 RepID=A0A3P7REP3_9BILA|nr:unnamed protein product [Gongylonema pulchrum]
MLTRGSSFYFPTSRVLHEIEVEGPGKRDGPQPRFTRYPLQHQAPRQHLYNTGNKYSPPPTARNAGKVAEVIPENVQEEQLVNSAGLDAAAVAAMSKGEEFPTVDASLTGGHENVVS